MTTTREIITRSFKLLQYYAEGENPSAEAMSDGLAGLNSMMASWHNQGLLVFYPPSARWIGEWRKNYVYAVGDGVNRNGATYECSAAHTSSANDMPGSSPDWSDYWTLYAETPLTLASTFPLDASHERGVQALLAVEMAPMFNVDPSALLIARAKDGMNAIYGQYFKVPEASSDPGITRMPSQIWPYSIPSVS